MLVAGTMIGSGIFVVPRRSPATSVLPVGWWRMGPHGRDDHHGALSHAELAAMMLHAGDSTFTREAFSPLWDLSTAGR